MTGGDGERRSIRHETGRLRPERPIPHESTRIHGITFEDSRDRPGR